MQRDKSHLLDVYKACQQILEFTEGTSKGLFYTDIKTQSAVLHQLLILGEAVKRLLLSRSVPLVRNERLSNLFRQAP